MSHRNFTGEQEQAIAQLYQEGLSYPQIAKQFGVKFHLIGRVIKRQGVTPRHSGRYPNVVPENLVAIICNKYSQGDSQATIAGELKISQSTVSRVIRKTGIARPHRQNRDGHGNWKGGRLLTPAGYIEVLSDRAALYYGMANAMGYVLEHRLIMAQHLGRCLTQKETVHHKNGDKADNKLENLELRQGKHGTGITLVCADCGSRNITED